MIACTTVDKQCACRASGNTHGCKTPTRRIQFHSMTVDIAPLHGVDSISLSHWVLNTRHCTIVLLCQPSSTIRTFVSPLRAMRARALELYLLLTTVPTVTFLALAAVTALDLALVLACCPCPCLCRRTSCSCPSCSSCPCRHL